MGIEDGFLGIKDGYYDFLGIKDGFLCIKDGFGSFLDIKDGFSNFTPGYTPGCKYLPDRVTWTSYLIKVTW